MLLHAAAHQQPHPTVILNALLVCAEAIGRAPEGKASFTGAA
jgi:hypothetical protein